MRIRLIPALVLLATACSHQESNFALKKCTNGECAEGFVCNPITDQCVQELAVDCSGAGICPSTVSPGDECPADGGFIPCVDTATDCSQGCYICENGVWSTCQGGGGSSCQDNDGDGLGDGSGGNTTCVNATTDSNDNDASICADTDGDGCDDCSTGTFDPAGDGTDTDGDGICDVSDDCTDSDGDGIGNGNLANAGCVDPVDDSDDTIATLCADTDMDMCDDCSTGTFDVANDGADADGDGICNLGDNCADADGDGVGDGSMGNATCVTSVTDTSLNDPLVCADTDGDMCDDCSTGMFDPAGDGPDSDGDTICDAGDLCAGFDDTTCGTRVCNALLHQQIVCVSGDCSGRMLVADCDDGNPCTADACDPMMGCTNTPVAPGAQCADMTPDDCDDAICDINGICQQTGTPEMAGYVCRADNGMGCDAPETCNGSSGGACPGDVGVPNMTICRAAMHSTCDQPERCDGTPAACPPEGGHAMSGLDCGTCQECNGLGTCVDDLSQSGDCPACQQCGSGGSCTNQIAGSDIKGDCDDGLFCNGVETCDGSGMAGASCQAGTNPCMMPTVCDEMGDACVGCTNDNDCPACEVCNMGTNTCQPAMAGTDPKGNCTSPAACETGSCNGMSACGIDPDGTPCGDNVCDECLGGSCMPTTSGSVGPGCTDATNTLCTNPDTCDGMGACQPNHASNGTACGDLTCDECTNGACAPSPAGTPGPGCTDATSNTCTNPDTCNGSGGCQGNHNADGTACGDLVCDECSTGVCSASPGGMSGPGCTDATSNTCTAPDTCNGTGGCATNNSADGIACGDMTCDECSGGTCIPTLIATAGPNCNDMTNNDCTAPDACDGTGGCQVNHTSDGTACNDMICDECSSGACVPSTMAMAGPGCNDLTNNTCTNPDTCDGAGACQPNHAADGTACADLTCDECTTGVCNPTAMATAGPGCNDTTNDGCTSPDTCDGAGACNVNHASDGTACGDLTCDECTTGACGPSTMGMAGPGCNNSTNDTCTSPDTCDGAGGCNVNHAADGTACGDMTCDECATGACTPTTAGMTGPNCTDTNDDDCDNPDSCDGLGACQTNFESDGTACGDLVCDECATGACVETTAGTSGPGCTDATDTDCENPDTCEAGGVCVSNTEMNGTSCTDCASTPSCDQTGCSAGTCPDCIAGDTDSDGICDDIDNCPMDSNNGQADTDSDGWGDACDVCAGFDDALDFDGDSTPDGCDECQGWEPVGQSCNSGSCGDSCDGSGSCVAVDANLGDPCPGADVLWCNSSCDGSGTCDNGTSATCDDNCGCSSDNCVEPGPAAACDYDFSSCSVVVTNSGSYEERDPGAIDVDLNCQGKVSDLTCTTSSARLCVFTRHFETGLNGFTGSNIIHGNCGSNNIPSLNCDDQDAAGNDVLRFIGNTTANALRTGIDATGFTNIQIHATAAISTNTEAGENIDVDACCDGGGGCTPVNLGSIDNTPSGGQDAWGDRGPFAPTPASGLDGCADINVEFNYTSSAGSESAAIDRFGVSGIGTATLAMNDDGDGTYSSRFSLCEAATVTVTCTWATPDGTFMDTDTVTFTDVP